MESKTLTHEEIASLLIVGPCTVNDPPSNIPAEHRARLIALGYMVNLYGRLRMTTPGRVLIAAEFQNTPLLDTLRGPDEKLSTKPAEHTEHNCPACNGTGFPFTMQPVQPDRRIYPVQCKNCGGKGRIEGADMKEAAN